MAPEGIYFQYSRSFDIQNVSQKKSDIFHTNKTFGS